MEWVLSRGLWFFSVLVFQPHFVTWACAGSAGPAIPVPRQSGLPGLWAVSTQLWVPFPGQPCSFPGCLCPSAVIWALELSTGKWSSNWLFVIWRSSKLNLTKEPRNCILPPPLFSFFNPLKKWGIQSCPMPHRNYMENWKQAPVPRLAFWAEMFAPCHVRGGESRRFGEKEIVF